jgi:triosephosphate isomerase
MRKPLIAGNWKMFKTIAEATAMVTDMKQQVAAATGVEIVIAPVFTALSSVSEIVSGSNIHLAAQDCYWEEEGAFTGEVSPKLLKDAGCSHVIIGHSERRQYFGETDESVNKKVKAALASGLTAIVCVGETLAERDTENTFSVIEKQISGGLEGISYEFFEQVVIAYEPVWAIGTGKTASDAQAQEVHAYIRSLLSKLSGQTVAEAVRVIYGGSVKPENINGLMSQEDIDGALVGGASLKAESFAAIVNFID